MLKRLIVGLLILVALSLIFLVWTAFASHRMSVDLGYLNANNMSRELKELPNSPNCVSTQTKQDDKRLAPLTFSGDANAAQARLKALVLARPRTKLISEETGYLHFTFKTFPIPFIDDVEFLFDGSADLIHFRSASRVGYSDLGANSKRMKKLSRLWAAE